MTGGIPKSAARCIVAFCVAAFIGLAALWGAGGASAQTTAPASADSAAQTRETRERLVQIADDEFDRGVDAFNEERFEDAVAAFTRAIQARPKFFDAMFNRAVANLALKRPKEALKDLDLLAKNEKKIKTVPDIFWFRAEALALLNHYAEAVADGERYLKSNPKVDLREKAAQKMEEWRGKIPPQ